MTNHIVPKKKVCFITTISLTMKTFVVETAKYLYEKCGYDVTLICSPDDDFAASLPEYLHYIPVHMNRGMDFSALRSIFDFIRIFQREQFDMVQYSTPNAACYASIAAKIAKVPIRLYAQWGIRYTGMKGFLRLVFRAIEKVICCLSTHVRSVSPLNMAFGIQEKLYSADKVKVVGNGGTIGVDMAEYNITQKKIWRNTIREKCGLSSNDFVFGFAGRVSSDKGCTELLTAFKMLTETNKNVKLLVVGPVEDNCGVDDSLIDWAKIDDRIVFAGKVDNRDMRMYYAAMNVLVHPTYREGFGMVIQEAGALAIPVITTKIPGASEVMVDRESCLLVKPKDSSDLLQAMRLICETESMAEKLGESAYLRTQQRYGRKIMLENQRKDYENLFGGR